MTRDEATIKALLEELLRLEEKYPTMRDEFQKLYEIMEYGPPGSKDDLTE